VTTGVIEKASLMQMCDLPVVFMEDFLRVVLFSLWLSVALVKEELEWKDQLSILRLSRK
jgi:hypothetical protein